MAFEAAGSGAPVQRDGSGWTRCARILTVGALAAATLVSGTSLVSHAAAATAARPQHVIVRGEAGCGASVLAAITQGGGTITRPLHILDGAAATVSSTQLAGLRANPCIAAVTPDAAVALSGLLATTSPASGVPAGDIGSLSNTTKMIGAPSYWNAGYTGIGVDVALIDSGVSPVMGLGGAKVVNGPDISFDSQSTNLQSLDGFGHGTHMAGIIAGHDPLLPTVTSALSSTPSFAGVAPNAHIVSVKVADAHGAADVSQVIAGIDWTVQHAHDPGRNIRVINLSFGTDSVQAYQLDPLAYAAEQAWMQGIVVVVAAGNGGTSSTTLTDPAIDPFVIAVGAVDTNGSMSSANHSVAGFSSTGSASRSPDLVAPGVHIESLRVPGSYLDSQYGSTATVGVRYFLGSGTSQATAVVSGAAALVAQRFPSATPDQIKAVLTGTANPLNNDPTNRQGNGEINLAAGPGMALPAKAGKAVQSFAASSGTGPLEGSRGSIHLLNSGVTLTGEQDIFGHRFDSAAMAAAEASASAWDGGTFNGCVWSGSGWSGSGWSNATWTSNAWSGSGWSGSAWSTNVWTGSGWSGSGWSGSGWSGSGWSGSGWSNVIWA
jgi:serine protease AprX